MSRRLVTFCALIFTASCQKESQLAPPLEGPGVGQAQNSPVPTQTPASAEPSDQKKQRASAAVASDEAPAPESGRAPRMAVARMLGLGGHRITGAISFAELPGRAGVKVTGTLRGLKPGAHGFHVHEHAACGKDGMAAGGHYNPGRAPHGPLGAAASHMGDMGNIVADKAGVARISLILPSATLDPEADSLVGHALLVHAGADDLSSQPAGDAGARVACAIITGP